MTHYVEDRVKEQASSSGLAAFTLDGQMPGFVSFATALPANGDTTWYCAVNGNDWEIGLGTRTSAAVLARTTVIRSSNANASVNFSAAPIVFTTLPGSKVGTVAGVDLSTAWAAYTPTVTAGTGTFTTVSAAGRYKQIGKTVFASMRVTITNLGTAGTDVRVTLPVTAISRTFAAAGRENGVTGTILTGYVDGTQTKIVINRYDGAFIGANSYVLDVALTYETP